MMIRMTHPIHGEMDVYTDVEATTNEKNGWKRKQEIPAVESRVEIPVARPEITPEIIALNNKKRGRPKKDN